MTDAEFTAAARAHALFDTHRADLEFGHRSWPMKAGTLLNR